MILLKGIIRQGGPAVIVATVCGLMSGMASAFLITQIGSANFLETGVSHIQIVVLLAGTTFIVITNVFSNKILIRISANFVYTMRNRVFNSILKMPHSNYERIGKPKAMATITEDVDFTASAVSEVPALLTNIAKVCVCTLYLAWLSLKVFTLLIIFSFLVMLLFKFFQSRANQLLTQSFDLRDRYFRFFEDLLDGERELKLDSSLRRTFTVKLFDPVGRNFRDISYRMRFLYECSSVVGHNSYFLFIALLLAANMTGHLASDNLMIYALVGLYMRTSLIGLVNAYPILKKAEKAFENIESFNEVAEERQLVMQPVESPWKETRSSFELKLENIRYFYHDSENPDTKKTFHISTSEILLKSGEIVFLTGGNGSGKTTLLKLLTGLYKPNTGRILLNQIHLTDDNMSAYQDLCSVVFSQHRLFSWDSLHMKQESREDILTLMTILELDPQSYLQDSPHPPKQLSSGQTSRMVLLQLLLLDRPIVIFDEWAAHQDPPFKEIFYQQLLPEMKRKGKLVLIITHDDKYFHLADRVLKIEDGLLHDS